MIRISSPRAWATVALCPSKVDLTVAEHRDKRKQIQMLITFKRSQIWCSCCVPLGQLPCSDSVKMGPPAAVGRFGCYSTAASRQWPVSAGAKVTNCSPNDLFPFCCPDAVFGTDKASTTSTNLSVIRNDRILSWLILLPARITVHMAHILHSGKDKFTGSSFPQVCI